MSHRPVASVVVTSYNTPNRLLAISLLSILGQSLEDIELILVVDGDLTPENEELVDSLQRADERLVVFQPGRVGRAQALNLGLDAARSPLIGIQDADDASHPRRLEIQSALLELTPKLAVLGAGARISASVTATADWPLSDGDPKVFVVGRSLLRSNPVVHSSVLARREALVAVGGYDERRTAQFDYDLLLRLKAQGISIGHCDLPLVLQRRHPGQFFEGLAPASRAWGSCRLQLTHISQLEGPAKLAYYGVAGGRFAYQVARGMAWHRAAGRHRSAAA
jgi:glycosyltransferase involved in cell wall biosynthesis